ncbi:hypothetical protein H2200_011064 [Cladophialophora chaetospira]|uniref:Uncharacterized protein n=1 Tax=Cladophialophora chaetospira TaxID=386627 RepID=A0AA38WZY8_9EURO|nr:hypothetical protein H2200_011064 [Cladophialophora chaetospira]
MPFGGAYCTGKGALIRAVSCIQKELEMDGFGDSIHVYALHPGATLSQPSLSFHPDVAEAYPQEAEKWSKFHKLFKCPPAQCAQTCAFLAAGRGKILRGRYFDCEQDIGTVIAAGEEGLNGLYELKVEFLGGLPNDGGTAVAVIEHQTNGDGRDH